ncbi:hypothetical protein Skr01_57130 [Sphaerisporangium krabiense]|uniref:Uncharacterized LabA/DUF88 family protein n=1 Tax=Sphaerisporangium krabiense TaxID=763782 RepID=A0A7W8Z8M9_9ACTN|nr:NYN domain-containing protein [Sphaerisporangium krabiense]MBB5629519.1 uncharacterized LabA/DUF88 family protein [Sphaerisporangium krabiense]GII65628.1 hypothetical protein Skr01_57130 [Sphaerisporangium krabiense]
MKSRLIGMIDAGFINASAARTLNVPVSQVRFEGRELVGWLNTAAVRMETPFVRCYWYDGAYPEGEKLRHPQRERFAELEKCPGLQLRLGHAQTLPFEHKGLLRRAAEKMGIDYSELMANFNLETLYEQKGVDTLIVLDMMRFVQQNACDTIVLVAGDRDLAEAIRAVQQLGCRVILAHPAGAPVAQELRNLADEQVIWSATLIKLLTTRHIDRFNLLYDENKEHPGQAGPESP